MERRGLPNKSQSKHVDNSDEKVYTANPRMARLMLFMSKALRFVQGSIRRGLWEIRA